MFEKLLFYKKKFAFLLLFVIVENRLVKNYLKVHNESGLLIQESVKNLHFAIASISLLRAAILIRPLLEVLVHCR